MLRQREGRVTPVLRDTCRKWMASVEFKVLVGTGLGRTDLLRLGTHTGDANDRRLRQPGDGTACS